MHSPKDEETECAQAMLMLQKMAILWANEYQRVHESVSPPQPGDLAGIMAVAAAKMDQGLLSAEIELVMAANYLCLNFDPKTKKRRVSNENGSQLS